MPTAREPAPSERLVRVGRMAWAVVGLLAVAWAVLYVAGRVSVVVVAVVIALFPAALLDPVAARVRRSRVPGALGALLLVLLLVLVFAVPAWLVVPRVVDQVPALADSVVRGLEQLEDAVDLRSLPGSPGSPGELAQQAFDRIGSGTVVDQGLAAVAAVTRGLTGTLLVLVVLFFCLKDGPRLWRPFVELAPARHRRTVDAVGGQVWWTLGAFLRGQLLVAFFDALFIGLGLWLLDVPLVLPLAVLVLFGGLFPIVGAFVSGLVAVLVALADGGPVKALLVLGLVLLVQQIEGNVFQPYVMSSMISLHPLLIILAVTSGGLVLGVLGAFLAVPVAAAVSRTVDMARGRTPSTGPVGREAATSVTAPREAGPRGADARPPDPA
ncbi:AI-2E family transporter [Thalassiella azotivora]